MSNLNVELGSRSYPIHIGAQLLARTELFAQHLRPGAVCIVTDDNVAPLYLDTLGTALAKFNPQSLKLPHGERYKSWQTLEHIFQALLKNNFGRDATLIALGGGVIGDLTGFGAAIYQRGVDYIQVPTTLLAQVDSSVGGKTAINHRYGKNMIGAFHQPRAVIADTDTLKTLPPREFKSGLAEVIKYGLAADADFFEWLEGHIQSLLNLEAEALRHTITRACEIKAGIVAEDERESGRRALLNLGHTFGHAIETGLGYGTWLHGEAVAAGLAMATEVSTRMGWLTPAEQRRILRLLERAGLPNQPPPELTAAKFRSLMAHDKKTQGGKLRLVLPKGIGTAQVTAEFERAALDATLERKPP